MMQLQRFFATMRPFLAGEIGTDAVEAALGPSPSGSSALGFYQVLAHRNVAKAMRELYPSLPALAARIRPGLWTELIHRYVRRHPPAGHHPDDIGRHFAAFMDEAASDEVPDVPPWLVECADLHRCQLAAATAETDADLGDGVDERLFIRQYRFDVVALVADSTGVDLDQVERPTPVLIFRSWRDRRVYTLRPRPIHLFALGRRQSLPVTSALDTVSSSALDHAERWLIAKGVLRPRTLP